MGISLSGGPFTYNRFDLIEGSKPDFLDMDKDGDKKESFKKAVKDKENKKDCGCKKDEDCDCSDKKKEVKGKDGKPLFKEESYDSMKDRRMERGGLDGNNRYDKAPKTANTSGAKKPSGKSAFDEVKKGFQKQYGKKSIMDTKKEEITITKDDVIAHLIENNYVNNEVSAEVMFSHITDEFLELIEATIEEGYMPMNTAKVTRQRDKAYDKEQAAVKAGDKKEVNKQMQRRIAMTSPSSRKQELLNKNSNK